MMDENREIREGFVRQRRNLIISSVVLFFSLITGLTIEELNIFGTTLKLSEPYSVTYALLALTIYWFVRYCQFLNDLGNLGIHERFRIKVNDIYPKFSLWILRWKKDPVTLPPPDRPNAKVKLGFSNYRTSPAVFTRYFIKVHLDVVAQISDDKFMKLETRPASVKLTKPVLFYVFIHAWLYVIFRTHKFTEYLLPIALFLVSTLYFIYIRYSDLPLSI